MFQVPVQQPLATGHVEGSQEVFQKQPEQRQQSSWISGICRPELCDQGHQAH
jgi:hypothetical protein